jgi:hypothetical protein
MTQKYVALPTSIRYRSTSCASTVAWHSRVRRGRLERLDEATVREQRRVHPVRERPQLLERPSVFTRWG